MWKPSQMRCKKFQFPPLREGRRTTGGVQISPMDISIPAPARGATAPCAPCRRIHRYFNSRPCERGDVGGHPQHPSVAISIPAPARGATPAAVRRAVFRQFQFPPLREGRHNRKIKVFFYVQFQFPPLREGRQDPTQGPLAASKFQFPPLREGRPRPGTRPAWQRSYFNSRPCERGDPRRRGG